MLLAVDAVHICFPLLDVASSRKRPGLRAEPFRLAAEYRS